MERIASFSVDHNILEPGIYVSRSDSDESTGCITTTFDLRMTAPNREPVMDTAAVHALEHLGATFLRNDEEWKDRVIYFGPMGCRTGFYLLTRNLSNCLNLRVTSRARFLEPSQKNAATTTTPTLHKRNGGRSDMLKRRSLVLMNRTPTTPPSYPRISL